MESRLNIAIHTPLESLSDEQKELITSSWMALSKAEKETYKELAPKEEVKQ